MALGQAGISRQAGVLLHHQQRSGANARRGRGYPDQTPVVVVSVCVVRWLLHTRSVSDRGVFSGKGIAIEHPGVVGVVIENRLRGWGRRSWLGVKRCLRRVKRCLRCLERCHSSSERSICFRG